ncbi:MAG TPA: hypothetical protein VFV10_15905 [Gammaproteobacteria bacterium]|nr:hypothetical protein [Gammaproteobacteria bacterium]
MAESTAMQKLDELERTLGKGATFTPTERNLVLKHGVPSWLVLGSKMAAGPVADRCSRAIDHLSRLYDDVQPALPDVLRTKPD